MTKKQFVIALNKHLRYKNIYKEKELIDYSVFRDGSITINFTVNMVIDKKMSFHINDIGCFDVARSVDDLEYKPFKYLIEQGVL